MYYFIILLIRLLEVARLYHRNYFMRRRQATTCGGPAYAKNTRVTADTISVRSLPNEVRHRLSGPRVPQVPDTSD